MNRAIWIDAMFRSLRDQHPLFHSLHGFVFAGVSDSQPLVTTWTLLQFTSVYDPPSEVQFLSGSHGSFLSQQEESLPREPIFFKLIVTYAVLPILYYVATVSRLETMAE